MYLCCLYMYGKANNSSPLNTRLINFQKVKAVLLPRTSFFRHIATKKSHKNCIPLCSFHEQYLEVSFCQVHHQNKRHCTNAFHHFLDIRKRKEFHSSLHIKCSLNYTRFGGTPRLSTKIMVKADSDCPTSITPRSK